MPGGLFMTFCTACHRFSLDGNSGECLNPNCLPEADSIRAAIEEEE